MNSFILNAGAASGPVMVLTEPLSFWGAFDPRTGQIVDTHHAQSGAFVGGHILLLPETRGSGTAPGAIAEAIRRETAPLGIILLTPDINLAVGAAVASKLYGKQCPVLTVEPQQYAALLKAKHITIAIDGKITI